MIEVLVVDDNRRDALLVEICLTSRYLATVTLIDDGEEALRLLTRQDCKLDLVLLELTMRRPPGRQVLRRMRRLRPQVPIVVFSSSTNGEEISQAYAEGANMYVEKPADLYEFRRAIESVAQLWLGPLGCTRTAGAS